MRFNCDAPKEAINNFFDKITNAYSTWCQHRDERRCEWRAWFAWRPVKMRDCECVWLEKIEKRYTWNWWSNSWDPLYRELGGKYEG